MWSSAAASVLSLLSTLWLAQDNKTGMCEKNYSINPHLQDKTKVPFVGTRWQFLLDKIVQRVELSFLKFLQNWSVTQERDPSLFPPPHSVSMPPHTLCWCSIFLVEGNVHCRDELIAPAHRSSHTWGNKSQSHSVALNNYQKLESIRNKVN